VCSRKQITSAKKDISSEQKILQDPPESQAAN
jgi:hypothetical protein